MANIKINDTPSRRQWTASSGQTVFTYNFPIKKGSDLQVYKRASGSTPDDDTDILIFGVDYTVTGEDTADGGTVVLTLGATLGDIVTIINDKAVDRTAIYEQSSTITKEDLNNDFNDNVLYDKQLETILYDITPKYHRNELINELDVREDNLKLPILNDGYIWIGRGDFGDTPDDIISVKIGDFDALGLLNVDYVIGTANPALPNAQVLGSLGEGIVYNTPTAGTGVLSILNIGSGLSLDTGTDTLSATGGGGVVTTITQAGHTLVVGDWVRRDSGTNLYVTAQANSAENAEVIGVVVAVTANTFDLQQAGLADLLSATYGPFVDGTVYFLSETAAGDATATEPSEPGEISRPVAVAVDTRNVWVLPYRGQEIDVQGAASLGNGVNIITVNQAAHGFAVEDVLRVSASGTFAKAQADSFSNAQAVGIVVEVIDVDNFKLQTEGFTDTFAGKTAVNLYYLSDATAGLLTTTKPTAAGSFTKPMFVALTTGSGFILEQRQLAVEAESAFQLVNQVAHGLSVEDVVRIDNSGDYIKAQADSLANSRASGIVVNVIDVDNFVVQQSGYTTAMAGKTAGQHYWLSAGTAGLLTAVEPTTSGQVSKPMFRAKSATDGWILEQRPMLQPNANGGAGGSGNTILLQKTVIAGGETSIDFTGFSSAYYKYFIEIDDLVWDNASDELPSYFGTGAPVVYDKTASYFGPGVVIPLLSMNLAARTVGAGAAVTGPLYGRYQINDVTQTGSAYMKNLQFIAADQRFIPPSPLEQHENKGPDTSYVWYNAPVSVLTVTGFQLDPSKNGTFPAATFVRGTVRFYGILA